MQQVIDIRELKVGMFVCKIDLPWFKHPFLFSGSGLIRTQEQITELIGNGVRHVLIDPERSQVKPAGARPQPAPRPAPEGAGTQERPVAPALDKPMLAPEEDEAGRVPLERELKEASQLYNETISYAKTFISDVKTGKPIDYAASGKLVDDLIDSVFRNADAICTLTKLRMFDEYTYTHCINLAALSVVLGRHLGWHRNDLKTLGAAGIFHDIGKAVVPDEILNKPGKLTDEEFAVMKTHTTRGYELLKAQSSIPEDVAQCAWQHHERWDGRGYPRGLGGDGIIKFAVVMSVVDVYDALTSERVYKKGMPPTSALKLMYQHRDQDFHTRTLEGFIKCLGIYPVTSLVRLSSGDYGIVCESNAERPLRPKVRIIMNRNLSPVRPRTVDLATCGEEGRFGLTINDCVDPGEMGIDLNKFAF